MRRRRFLARSLALSAATLGGCKLSLEQGLFNECRDPQAHAISRHPLVLKAWEGLRPERVWDCHAHLFGNGRSGAGIWLNPEFDRPGSIVGKARRVMFANAGCSGEDEERLDQGMVRRLTHVVDEMPEGSRVLLLAFDFVHDETGAKREDLSSFCIPNEYAKKIAQSRPDRFEWIGSVHPYRPDALEALERAKAAGARAVKWLPPAMGIDPANPRCVPFYDALKRLDLPLLVHVGEEQAVPGAQRHEFANPLHLRHPLDRGVRVIAAHCASLGESPDLDANRDPDKARAVANIDLFARLMAERRYEGLIFGDLSAITQANRAEHLPLILERREWHARLLHGTDYPLPGIMPLFSLSALVRAGLLAEETLPVINELRHVNPLMFDFVLKRNLRYRGQGFSDAAFETRGFFERAAA